MCYGVGWFSLTSCEAIAVDRKVKKKEKKEKKDKTGGRRALTVGQVPR